MQDPVGEGQLALGHERVDAILLDVLAAHALDRQVDDCHRHHFNAANDVPPRHALDDLLGAARVGRRVGAPARVHLVVEVHHRRDEQEHFLLVAVGVGARVRRHVRAVRAAARTRGSLHRVRFERLCVC